MTHTLTAAALALCLTSAVAAQSFRWVAGLDFTADIFQTIEKTGPGPKINKFGYDNTTGTATVLYPFDQCFVTWQTWPDPGHGAVIGVIQHAPTAFALLHEDGHLKLDQQPDSAWCTPIKR